MIMLHLIRVSKKTGQLADDSEFLSEIYFSLYSTTNFKTPAIIYFIPPKNLKIVDVDSGRIEMNRMNKL